MHRKLLTATIALLFAGNLLAQPNAPITHGPNETIGPNPQLAKPVKRMMPTVHIPPAKGWPEGARPVAAPGLTVAALATGLDHPRWVYVPPNGDALMAESNAPPKPDDGKSTKGAVMGAVMKRAGAGVQSANHVTLLRDADGDGVAEVGTTSLQGLNSPIGMALVGNNFYVANLDAVLRFPYVAGKTQITAAPTKVFDLPAGRINHLWTQNIIASVDGSNVYGTVGSNSNVAEFGMDAETGRATIWEFDIASCEGRLFATGLSNPNGMAWSGGKLWTVANGRDELGNDLVPDYLMSVTGSAFYDWPYSYFGQNIDVRVKRPAPELVAKAVKPDYALGSHVAPLGLASAEGTALPAPVNAGFFIGQHGSRKIVIWCVTNAAGGAHPPPTIPPANAAL